MSWRLGADTRGCPLLRVLPLSSLRYTDVAAMGLQRDEVDTEGWNHPLMRSLLQHRYLTRAPFDRWIVLYLYGLFGHTVSVLTHNCSGQALAPLRAVPSLVASGVQDLLVNPQSSTLLAEMLGCEYLGLHAGHMAHVERPSAFAYGVHNHILEASAAFLAGGSRGAPGAAGERRLAPGSTTVVVSDPALRRYLHPPLWRSVRVLQRVAGLLQMLAFVSPFWLLLAFRIRRRALRAARWGF
jgi:hypothetical protein